MIAVELGGDVEVDDVAVRDPDVRAPHAVAHDVAAADAHRSGKAVVAELRRPPEQVRRAASWGTMLRFVDLMKDEQKLPPVVDLNPMGKIPVLVDGDVVVTETASPASAHGAESRVSPAFVSPRPTRALAITRGRRSRAGRGHSTKTAT